MPLAAEKERRFVDVPVLTVFHSISLYFISSFRRIQFVQSTPLIILPNLADQCNIRALVATSQPRAAYDPYRGVQDKVELPRIWGVGEEKCGILKPGGFDG